VPSLGDSIERRVEFVARLEAITGAVAGRTVLDLGCGRQALWSRAYATQGAHVVAVELDAARCAEAVARLAADPARGPGRVLGVVRGDGERLPIRDEAIAFVHCAQVLEHVASPPAFLAELRRVLSPAGCLMFIEHVRSEEPGLARWQDRLNGLNRRVARCNCNRRTLEGIRAAGFTITTIYHDRLRRVPPFVSPLIVGIASSSPPV